ncbi:MAG: SpoIID/LytB domain-containing protein [Candidatus Algichlamydia australiensis]|nr:SpoIID/LytB domain-containing protein [Chlamydiales bacterium]
MLKKVIFLFSPLILFSFGAPLSELEVDKPATIKVLLEKGIEGAVVEVKGPHKIFNPMDGRQLKTRFFGKRFYLQSIDNGIKWGENYDRIHQIRIVPTRHDATLVVNGIEYRGCLNAYLIENRLYLVNEVDIESYLKSTLVSTLPENLHHEVIDALAIIARTNAYHIGMEGKKSFWNVDANQVNYRGQGVTMLNKDVERAVSSTRHLVMLYDNRPFSASWNENCAGRTANYSTVYRKKEKTPSGVKVPIAEKERNNHTWCFALAKSELANIVKTNRITELELFQDGPSSKVYAMRIKDGAHNKDLNFFELQEIVGKERLISNDFSVRVDKNQVLFEGFGRGMGVGLCLFSAEEYAKRDLLAPKILSQFFPGTQLEMVRSYDDLNRSTPLRAVVD